MQIKDHFLRFKYQIAAPINEVFNAFTNATSLTEWLCSVAQVDPHKGGRIYLWWENGFYASGEIIELIPGDRMLFSWHGKGEPGTSRVKITFKSRESGTGLTLTHLQIGREESWKKARRSIRRGWKLGLENLKSVMETGQDLRFTHRPMLGFTSVQMLNAEEAAAAGLPAKAGLRILGVIPDTGLDRAGFLAGDYLVKFAGQKIASLQELNQILSQYRAGNKVKLMIYRKGEKIQKKCELSPIPMPTIPNDPEELSLVLSKMYAQLNLQLEQLLEGVEEEQLEMRDSPSNWSIRETLAHLISAERELHGWISRMIDGHESDFSFRTNQPIRVRATISAYPDFASLFSQLKHNQEETVAMVADLPAEILNQRRRYWRIALELLQSPPLHYQEHLELVRLALEKAKKEQVETGEIAGA